MLFLDIDLMRIVSDNSFVCMLQEETATITGFSGIDRNIQTNGITPG